MSERPQDIDINQVLRSRYVRVDDQGWYKCMECSQKVYLGDDNAADFWRHERRYHQDSD